MTYKNIFNADFQDLLIILNKENVEYILVGGYLVILNGYNRYTGDLDLWVNPSSTNYVKLKKAFSSFGLPIQAISKDEFLDTDKNEVFSFGIPPIAIDFLTSVKGLNFDLAFKNSKLYTIEEDLKVRGLSKSDLILAKKAAGRNKDLDDLEKIK